MNPLYRWLMVVLTATFLTGCAVTPPSPEPISGPAWPDRRPIARVFLTRSTWCTPQNPGGHLGPQHDLTTPAGREKFSAALLAEADRIIGVLQAADAQGIVVWDVEGQEWPGMVYVGDPRVLPEYAPQINDLIDPFFQRIRDAGFRTGVCLRPNYIFRIPVEHLKKYGRDPHNTWGYMLYREPGLPITKPEITWWAAVQRAAEKDPVLELAARADYAHRRWGTTLHYVDTNSQTVNRNGQPKDVLMTAEQFGRLARLAPGRLFMPEHETDEYYAISAPYNQLDMTGMTPPRLRAKYPGCFTVNSGDEIRYALTWDDIVAGVVAGDALYVETTGSANDGSVWGVRQIYREAELRRAGRFPSLSDEVARLLDVMQTHDEWVVRRATLPLLAKTGDAKAEAALLAEVRHTPSRLGLYAATAIGRESPNAVRLLEELLHDQSDEGRFVRHRAVTGLRLCRQPGADLLLVSVLHDKYSMNRGWALATLRGRLPRAGAEVRSALAVLRDDPQSNFKPAEIDELLKQIPGSKPAPPANGLLAAWEEWLGRGAPVTSAPADLPPAPRAEILQLAAAELALARTPRNLTVNDDGDAVPRLWVVAQDDDPVDRYHAVAALEAARDLRSVEPLAGMLQHESTPAVAWRMLRALVRLDPNAPHTRAALQAQAESENAAIRSLTNALRQQL